MADENIEYIEIKEEDIQDINQYININIDTYNLFTQFLILYNEFKNKNNGLYHAYYMLYYLFTSRSNKDIRKLSNFLSVNDDNYMVIFKILDNKLLKLEIIYNIYILSINKIFKSQYFKLYLEYLKQHYNDYLLYLNQPYNHNIKKIINYIIEILVKSKEKIILMNFKKNIMDFVCSLDVADYKINLYADFLTEINKVFYNRIYSKLISFIENIIYNNIKDLYLYAESACSKATKFCKKNTYEYSYCMHLKAQMYILQHNDRSDSKLVMSIFLNQAYQIYVSMKKEHREGFISSEKLQEMQDNIIELRKKSQEELVEIKSPEIDISEDIEQVTKRMHNKKFDEAIKEFAFIAHNADYDAMYKYAIHSKKDYIFQSLFPKIIFNHLGQQQDRVVYDKNKSEYENSLFYMLLYNKININFKVQVYIYPALKILLEEHGDKITKEFLYNIVKYFGISKDKELLILDGLYYGFKQEFIASTHIIIPQIENILREILISDQKSLSLIEKSGKDIIKGINTILSEQYRKILWDNIGNDLYMDFKTLLDDEKGGLNLRNHLSHGLLPYDTFKSVYPIYLWWIMFRWFFILYIINSDING